MKTKLKIILSSYFNCTAKGAISLFMALLMTPFLTIAMILMDAGKYNSAVSILDEAMGVSATSTLAHHDSYLHERWGLLGMDQGEDLYGRYSRYLEINSGVMGQSIELDEIHVQGMYELADNQVLYNQIMEYCKLNAPTELATNFLNISDLIGKLEKMKNIGKIFDALAGGAGALDSTITMVRSADTLKSTASDMESLIEDYERDYSDLENAVSELIRALNEPKPEKSDYTDEEGELDTDAYEAAVEEWEQDIRDARTGANRARDIYADTIGELKDSMTIYRDKMGECLSAFGGITSNLANATASATEYMVKSSASQKNLKALQSDIKKMENDTDFDPQDSTYLDMKDWEQALSEKVAEENIQYQLAKAGKNGLSAVKNGYEEHFSQYSDETFGRCIDDLEQLKITVEEFDAENYSEDSGMIRADIYHGVALAAYVKSDEIEAYLAQQKDELLGGSLKDLLEGLVAFYNSIFKMSTLYEPEFRATIDMNYYNTTLGGLPGDDANGGSAMAIVTDIGNIVTEIKEFGSHLQSLKLLTALLDLKSLIQNLMQLCKDIAQFVINILRNIMDLFSSYDRLYYSTYATFNLPCRTDRGVSGVSFTGLSGYSLNGSSLPKQEIMTSPGIFDDLAAAITTLRDYTDGVGDDLTFSGAELEYILYGSECELANQMYTFFALYLLRLMLDVIPVTANTETQALAAASTFGYPLVMGLLILAEPLADTLLLVNGGEVEFWKTSIYLTPSGLPGLLENFVTIAKFTPDQKEELKGSLTGAFGATNEDYDYQKTLKDYEENKVTNNPTEYIKNLQKFNYREYCFFILLLTVTKEQQFSRLKNLIQMETLYHYKDAGEAYVFDLRKSYTYLDTEVNSHVKQLMPSLIDSSTFTVTRQQYRGY